MLQPDPAAGKAVDKGPQVSNWSDPAKLSPQQIKYAAMDAVVSVEVHAQMQKVLEAALREDVGAGDKVLVLDRTKNSRVAVGIIKKVTTASSSTPPPPPPPPLLSLILFILLRVCSSACTVLTPIPPPPPPPTRARALSLSLSPLPWV